MDQRVILDRIRAWAEDDNNIRLMVVTGSVARGEADVLSDIDAELFVQDPVALLTTSGWYEQFGTVLAVEARPLRR